MKVEKRKNPILQMLSAKYVEAELLEITKRDVYFFLGGGGGW